MSCAIDLNIKRFEGINHSGSIKTMKAGFFEMDITPAVGDERPACYGKIFLKGVHDRLKVKAAVLHEDAGKEPVALVSVDTCIITSPFVRDVREAVQRQCGIPPERIMLAATHTHAGGSLWGFTEDELADAPELVKDLALNHSTAIRQAYRQRVIGAIVTAVAEAQRREENALFSIGRGADDFLAKNRRFRMKGGKIWTHPGKAIEADIISPAGPIDPEVGVIGFWKPDGTLMGCMVNYACHATTYGDGLASADYINYVEQAIRGVMGEQAILLFFNGASGDITQVDNLSDGETESGEKYSRMLGIRVGAEALKALVSSERSDIAKIDAKREIVHIKRRKLSAANLAKAREIVMKGLRDKKFGMEWAFAKEKLILDYIVACEPEASVEVMAIQVGPGVLLCNPAEFFCQLGLNIKKGSHFPFTFVVELANGCIGYVPTEEDLAETGGGYETRLTAYTNLEPRAGSVIVTASLALSAKLSPGFVPKRLPKNVAKSNPWPYGNNAPELD